MSIFDTPSTQRQYSAGSFPHTPAAAGHAAAPLYPDLPAELRTPTRGYTGSSAAFATAPAQQPVVPAGMASERGAIVPSEPPPAAVSNDMQPIARGAKLVSDWAATEARFPQLDDIVSQGQSQEYEVPEAYPWEPYLRTTIHTIPDSIFEQYNRATSHTMLGLFAELKQAWITVDNRLYLWDYTTQTGFQGYEGQQNTITAVKLLTPKPGVFVKDVTHVLVLATAVDVMLLGVGAVQNAKGNFDITVYETRMSVPTRGLDVTVIEGSRNTGRIFFAGKGDNDVYEFTYQAEEKWFQGRCTKICHTSKGVSTFAPRLPFLGGPKESEYVEQMVVDDTRNLLYTLSSKSTIRAFNIRGESFTPSLTHSFSHTLANIRVMIGTTPELGLNTPIVSISPVPALQARRIHLIAVTTSGCRLYMSAAASDYGYGGSDMPTSMQVVHVRFPLRSSGGATHNNVRKATIFQPGYFFCFLDKGGQVDELLAAAPDSAKISHKATDATQPRIQLIETPMILALESRVEACELVTPPFAARQSPVGFGNETQVQFDLPPTEVAILTNTGVHMVRRRRLVEVFDSMVRYGSNGSPHGLETEVRRFFEAYGRAEGCASALAVACGASQDSAQAAPARVTDIEVIDMARRFFIEFGGKPVAEQHYDSTALPSLDQVKTSGRAEGLALYISRIVKSIWKANLIVETPSPAGTPTYSSAVSVTKLKGIQEQLVRLATFLHENRSFITGLSGAESLMVAGSKIDEVANQAEHRALHALVSLIESMVEGISFVLFLFDDKLDDIIVSLPDPQREQARKISYSGLFSTSVGQALAKELVTAIVNRNIAAGMNVDAIADALRRRCGSFCSADDVVQFKAVEQIRKAREETDADAKSRALRESLRLYEKTAATVPMDNLKETIRSYRDLGYYPGAVQLALKVAAEADRGNQALVFLSEAPTAASAVADLYAKRVECYQLVFQILEEVDHVHGQTPDMIDGVLSPAARLRNETWQLVYGSTDELFHNQLYDWLFSKGQAERLLEIDSPYVLAYLQRRGADSINHADLLWQYHAKRENFFGAAEVLHDLAQSDFDISLEKRLEFFSRARGFCNSYGALGTRQRMNELSQTIQEQLDVAVIQDDILRRIREDKRIGDVKKEQLERELDSKLMSLSTLFNRYADPYTYMDCCLAIFQAADYRGQNEIRKCWEQLITQQHDDAVKANEAQPWELVSQTVLRLGHRFAASEYVFPPAELVHLLSKYALTYVRDQAPDTWVVDTLLDSGLHAETVLRRLEEIFYRNEAPFASGAARKKLVRDAIYAADKWFASALHRSGAAVEFKLAVVKEVLEGMERECPGVGAAQLVQGIERRVGLGLGG